MPETHSLHFAPFRLDLSAEQLWCGAETRPLTRKAFAALRYLAEHAGQLVTKETLIAAVWGVPYVSDMALAACIREIRRSLDEQAYSPQFVETVRGRGYRFVAAVTMETIPEAGTGADVLTQPVQPAFVSPHTDHSVTPSAALQPGSPLLAAALPQHTVAHPVALSPANALPATVPPHLLAERRHLTVLLAGLVDATALASQMDLEEWLGLLHGYHAICATVMAAEEGYIAQYLGDGVLVYFGYPHAHEDDAQRAVRAGLALVEALQAPLLPSQRSPLRVRIGIHTGPVVISAVGTGDRQEPLALGETPQMVARLQEVAAPGTVVCSETTARLVAGYVIVDALGGWALEGPATPLPVYRVVGLSGAQSRLEATAGYRRTPFVGRDTEMALLHERWGQVQDGQGQVVVLSGEAGIGKSRLVQVMREQVVGKTASHFLCQCWPYQQQSPLAPLITLWQQTLAVGTDAAPAVQLHALEQVLAPLPQPLDETVPLFADLLSIPLPARYPALTMSPQQQKQQTLNALLCWLVYETEHQPTLLIVEDVHWIDPSTLEWLTLVLDQVPMMRLYVVLTCRPEYTRPWAARTYLTALTLSRLSPPESARMLLGVTGGKPLPPAVAQQVVSQTDGVPLFVEELTRMVLESTWLQEQADAYTLSAPLPPLAIPTTLQGSLMARLDRLDSAKTVAQLGALLGRQFDYAVLHAVAARDEGVIQHELTQLVDAELLYQRGVPPQATYRFKHALIQEAASASLLKSTRQQLHQQIAQILERRFPTVVETQPELVAQHYTAAGCAAPAVRYWQRAGQLANDRSAHLEAVSHLTTGIALLTALPDTPERTQYDLTLHVALGAALQMTKGQAAPEVEQAYTRARALCHQVGEAPELVPVLFGLWRYYLVRPQLDNAREIGEILLRLARRTHDPALAVSAHYALGFTWHCLGALTVAHPHLEEAVARYAPDQRHAPVFRMGQDLGVACRVITAATLWLLGYPERALTRLDEALELAHTLAYPYSLVYAHCVASFVYQFRRQVSAVYEQAEAAITLSTKQGFPLWAGVGTIFRGWALALQGQSVTGLAQIRQGIAACRSTGAALQTPYFYSLLADVAVQLGRPEEGLQALSEAQALMEEHEQRSWEAEIYRLRGVLLLQQAMMPQAEAEIWLQRALDTAHRQEAKSLELRAAMSLARLWQYQGKGAAAHSLLTGIYNWFTEGFDTVDLQAARALLEELAGAGPQQAQERQDHCMPLRLCR